MKQCDEIRNKLSEYIDDMLNEAESNLVEEHLSVCSSCREELHQLFKLSENLKSLKKNEPPHDFLQMLKRRIKERNYLNRFLKELIMPASMRVPVTVVLAVFIVVLLLKASFIHYRRNEYKNTYTDEIAPYKQERKYSLKNREKENIPGTKEPLEIVRLPSVNEDLEERYSKDLNQAVELDKRDEFSKIKSGEIELEGKLGSETGLKENNELVLGIEPRSSSNQRAGRMDRFEENLFLEKRPENVSDLLDKKTDLQEGKELSEIESLANEYAGNRGGFSEEPPKSEITEAEDRKNVAGEAVIIKEDQIGNIADADKLLMQGDRQLQISEEDRICHSDGDCVIISTQCIRCECGGTVNKVYEEKYIEQYKTLCKNYAGKICDYECRLSLSRCINNRCSLSPP